MICTIILILEHTGESKEQNWIPYCEMENGKLVMWETFDEVTLVRKMESLLNIYPANHIRPMRDINYTIDVRI